MKDLSWWKGTSACIGFIGALCWMGLVVGGLASCGEPGTTCSADADCSLQVCVQGRCVNKGSETPGADGGGRDASGGEAISDEGASDSGGATESLSPKEESSGQDDAPTDKQPAPSCNEAKPSCGEGPVCEQAQVVCENDKWVCKYPSDYEEKETLCDGKDNDCNGQVDENIVRPCYGGPAGTQGVGLCKAGTQQCVRGEWRACENEVQPKEEVCDDQDNNCDGNIDELWKEKGSTCAKGVGACKVEGMVVCSQDGTKIECNATPKPPSPEVCDNIDNDCNGQIDDNLSRSCYSGPTGTQGVGLCKAGEQVCSAGQWGACNNEVKPTTEICDNLDNDCDGSIDNGVKRACYTGPSGTKGVGTCKGGEQVCSAGQWGACSGEVVPATEVCNGKDENCDGTVDDGASICGGVSKVCVQAQCVCNTAKRYYPLGTACVTDGTTCPSNMPNGQTCVGTDHLAVCDPYGKIGILQCSTFAGQGCSKVAPGIEGCLMPSTSYNQKSCLNFSNGYTPSRSWQVVMNVVGPQASSAVSLFTHCVGGGRSYCGTIVTSAGNVTACMCSERSKTCNVAGRTMTLYDVSYYNANTSSCTSFVGTNFGCPDPLSPNRACTKGFVNGFATYACQ
ncbi:MAG: hypothetical protein EP343_03675 [Deltaproteobacteria bacterium]|nr:MAG: hypothetical protein EP343_03675 [Deltaproteobacteria bacterium]